MKFSQVLKLMNETKLQPEKLASYFGVSSMTLRRWQKAVEDTTLPLFYEQAIREGTYKLLTDKHLSADSKDVQRLLKQSYSQSFEAVISSLGVTDILNNTEHSNQDRMTLALAIIGQNQHYRKEVEKKVEDLLHFKQFGEQWDEYITTMMEVIHSKEVFTLDKMVAYGALFYLIYPFELIPDSIPVVGYLDDFAILALAMTYYRKRYPRFLKLRH